MKEYILMISTEKIGHILELQLLSLKEFKNVPQ